MEASRFDTIARSFADPTSRRGFLLVLAAAPVMGALGFPARAVAKKKRKRKVKFNAFGCLDVGQPCRGKNAHCCSGICQGKRPKKGKKDKSTCVAHNVQNCLLGHDFCQGVNVACGESGTCVRTTGAASFCAEFFICVDCKKDTDCDTMGFGPGAACMTCAAPEECPSHVTACARAGD